MRWQMGRRSEHVEDRRGMRVGGGGVALGGGTVLVIALVAMLMGVDPTLILQGIEQTQVGVGDETQQRGGPPPEGDEQAAFVSVVLADTEDTWKALFAGGNQRYQEPTLVLFSDAVQSACGMSSAAVGPFYCPADRKVYIDLGFFRELDARFGAPGDFARAYVVAHEVGHHVQNLLGIAEQVQRMSARLGAEERNALSVRQELQADCFAGVWGHHARRERNLLEEGDVEEGLNAAAAIGDDRLQRHAGGRVQPESWTHGSSEQRVQWLRRGLESGDVSRCDTFGDGRS
jgi:predicted metalloprotease